ncbi:hypothetical protein IUY40_19305, partial [Flavobacterium sp. ALJ2]|uniref:Calx-beta domain-containing protein n=1 Tax=Flavobacterium sp. ALJ2 TaxID=2786960 RepID=UPI001E65A034
LRFSTTKASVAEGESTTIEVGLPEGITVSSPVVVNYKISGEAINGTDYATLPSSVTIPAGSSKAIIKLDALRDNVIELDENVTLRGGDIIGESLIGFGWDFEAITATVTITDVTDEANKVLHFSPTTA